MTISKKRSKRLAIGLKIRRGFVVVANADAATEIDVMECDAFLGQRVDEGQYPLGRVGQGGEVGQLRADVSIDAGDFEVGQAGGQAV